MASIHRDILIDAPPEQVWDAARDIGALHTRLVPGFVVDTQVEEGARIVTFGNGMVIRELIIDVSDDRRRIAWAAVGTAMTHYSASFQVFSENGHTRGTWIADLLPNEVAPNVSEMMEQGLLAMKRSMEGTTR
ncbi:MAG TPA: SRPBCC family protein [Burkholderiaceae bacterium]|jgi:hypothetical protein|nr:SRPBCC family protein [Burkholderiaceae bacterium]